MVEILYREVTQAVLLFGSDIWVLLAAMYITVKETHTGFLRKIMGKRERQKLDVAWYTPEAEEVR